MNGNKSKSGCVKTYQDGSRQIRTEQDGSGPIRTSKDRSRQARTGQDALEVRTSSTTPEDEKKNPTPWH